LKVDFSDQFLKKQKNQRRNNKTALWSGMVFFINLRDNVNSGQTVLDKTLFGELLAAELQVN
jgi:hypothetical protein